MKSRCLETTELGNYKVKARNCSSLDRGSSHRMERERKKKDETEPCGRLDASESERLRSGGTFQRNAEVGEGRILGTDKTSGSHNHETLMATVCRGHSTVSFISIISFNQCNSPSRLVLLWPQWDK